MIRKVLQCEDSIEGILTAVYDGYMLRYQHDMITIVVDSYVEIDFFEEYIQVQTDSEKAYKVKEAINNKISKEAFSVVNRVALSCYKNKGDLIYHFLVLGFKMGREVLLHLTNNYVREMSKIAKEVYMEMHKLYGFVRFRELNNQVLFAKIKPKHNQIYLLGEHFSDRYPMEHFVIYDEQRHNACLHQKGKAYYILENLEYNQQAFEDISKDEEKLIELWKGFVSSVTIKERENKRLQMNFMPKRYWSNIIEMDRM